VVSPKKGTTFLAKLRPLFPFPPALWPGEEVTREGACDVISRLSEIILERTRGNLSAREEVRQQAFRLPIDVSLMQEIRDDTRPRYSQSAVGIIGPPITEI